ncbi:hypothetical protein GGQ92_000347 [Gracilibacillus halotolerans]|uniref:UPF0178 protein GGQ92_000347 n=2 Tax=Gracilibacillus halotolerans TaxID=74386 RepID=A0A841RCC4_9BACI|nr:hypothetical protein [Gracilibacillus halotolerans]
MMRIFIDADACPVTDIIVEEAGKVNLHVFLVRSYAHYSTYLYPEHVTTQYIDTGNDAVDYAIVRQIWPHDLVVTQDYGLAALCLAKKTIVLHHLGYQFKQDNIDSKLMDRHLHAKARKAGKRTKGPKKFTQEQKETFRKRLRSLLYSG